MCKVRFKRHQRCPPFLQVPLIVVSLVGLVVGCAATWTAGQISIKQRFLKKRCECCSAPALEKWRGGRQRAEPRSLGWVGVRMAAPALRPAARECGGAYACSALLCAPAAAHKRMCDHGGRCVSVGSFLVD